MFDQFRIRITSEIYPVWLTYLFTYLLGCICVCLGHKLAYNVGL